MTPHAVRWEIRLPNHEGEDATDFEALFSTLTRRYGAISPESLIKVLCPLNVPILSLDKNVIKIAGQTHWRASFTAAINAETREVLQVGRTGKFIPASHLEGGPWKELAKGRITSLNDPAGIADGEIYLGSGPTKAGLEVALQGLTDQDFLEIDQYGAAAKVLSALVESELATQLTHSGFRVRRMPEDTAKHLGVYPSYDFEVFGSDGCLRKVEVKSLWGTDTRYARLIHSKSTGTDNGQPNFYATSSCKYATQDIFAVSLFLRTGNVADFAFARSVSRDTGHPHGLPAAAAYPEYVNQNPLCTVGDGTWFAKIEDVWDLP